MRRLSLVLLIIAFVGLGIFLIYNRLAKESASEKNKAVKSENTAENTLASRTNSEAAVTVTVTPLNLGEGAESWDFEVSLETHSVELAQDLEKGSVLVDSEGKEYQPLSWKGSPPGGHHRSGVLKFKSISPRPQVLKLKIKDIASIPERNFEWPLTSNTSGK